MGLLRKPIPQPGEDFPIIQYSDDTLLILEAEARQLFVLKGILQSFSESTGLKVNYWKSQIIPINVSPAKMNILANIFGCQIGSMPSLTLGFQWGLLSLVLKISHHSWIGWNAGFQLAHPCCRTQDDWRWSNLLSHRLPHMRPA